MNNFLFLFSTLMSIVPANAADLNLSQAYITTETIQSIELKIDPRPNKIDSYFAKRKMPLNGYGKQFVKVADEYNIDWRLLPAIAVRESSGGKRLLNNNPFGWGTKIPFKDFNEAIEIVGWNLAGKNPNTAKYYNTEDIRKKLYYYNGTVIPSYPEEVLFIMDMFENTKVN
jgi:hypothetical protein